MPLSYSMPSHILMREQGLRLHERGYRPLRSVTTLDGGLLLRSEALGLDVRLEAGEELRFHDPSTGQDLLGYEESQARIAELEARLAQSS